MIAILQHRAHELIQDRYEILGVLGTGAYGTVYQCRDCELEITVAIKELHVLDDPQTGGNERELALAQFRHEAIHLSHLRHPHIVSGHYQPHAGTWPVCPVCGYTIPDAGDGAAVCPQHGAPPIVVRQRHYLVMEFVDGPNLAEAAEAAGGILDTASALRYIRQIAEALHLIHARGWVHRDIKPENIRVRAASDDAVLLDFGIATESGAEGVFSTRQMRHTTGGGTLGYAPDSLHERRFPDARSDIHALGMTLYRLVAGRDPQDADDLAALRGHRPRAFNSTISPALEALILQSIEPDPTRRLQNAAGFLRALAAIIEPASVSSSLSAAPAVLPLTFRAGEAATNLTQLVHLVEKYPGEAKDYLYNGDFATWLSQNGRADLAQRAREICRHYPQRRAQGLEAFLLATGLVEPPSLEVEPTHLDFGVMGVGKRRRIDVELRNAGRGHLFGILRSTHLGLDFPAEFDGNRVLLPITFDASRAERGGHSGDIVIDSSAGEWRLPFSATIYRKRSWAPAVTVVFWSVVGMLCGQWMRTLPLLHQTKPAGWHWLTADSVVKWFPAAPLFGLALWGVLLLFVLGEALRQKSCGLFVSGGLVSLLGGVFCAMLGNELLKTGDIVLQPLLAPVTRDWAAGGWMFVGGLAGACYGTWRRWRDVFSTRLAMILCGWLIAITILYTVLWSTFLLVPAYL